MLTKIFWERVLERFLRAFATAFVLTASVAEQVTGTGEQIQLDDRLYIALAQGVGAVMLSLAGGQVGDKTSPALLPSPPEPDLEADGSVDTSH